MKSSVEKDTHIAKKYVALQESAKARNKDFNLSLTSVRNLLLSKKCYYTGKKMKSPSIDCIDPEKGYVKGNVVACERHLNGRKNNLTFEEIKALYTKINNHNKHNKL